MTASRSRPKVSGAPGTSYKLRVNSYKSWYRKPEEVSTNGDYEVTFRLKRPQPAFLMLLASGFSPAYSIFNGNRVEDVWLDK
jgi:hypothetical protein